MTTLEASARETFANCAVFYDCLTAHHDYEAVARIVEELFDRHGSHGTRMLDVACGTGKSFLPFVRRGYEVTACDISPEMLEQARAKADGGARIVLADMRALPRLGSFDVVTCLDEPINYLLDPREVRQTLASIAANLRPGGILLFDLNTLRAFRTIFATDDCYEQDGWLFVWRGHGEDAAEPGARSGFTIEAFAEHADGRWSRFSNRHLQRHYPREEVAALLADAGLELAGVHGIDGNGALDESADEDRHLKLFYLARKPTRGGRR